MQTLICHAAQDLRIEDTPPPGALQPHELLVRVAYGGICGSDLHYQQHGGFGTVRIKEPMALGHEVSGVIEALGSGVQDLKAGQRIAISPLRQLPLLPARAAQPLPQHALLRQRHALPPHPGRLQRAAGD